MRLGCFLFCILCFSSHALAASLSYSFSVKGIKSQQAKDIFQDRSSLENLKKDDVPSRFLILKRARDDKRLLLKILHNHGYYEAQIDKAVVNQQGKLHITFTVTQGPRYSLDAIKVYFEGADKNIPSDAGVTFEKKHIQVDAIFHLFTQYIQSLSRTGFPFAVINRHEAHLDRGKKTVKIHLFIDPGEKVYFGPLKILKSGTMKESYLQRRVPWEIGDVYNSDKVDEYRNILTKSRVFKTIILESPKEKIHDHQIPVELTLVEDKPRTVFGGIGYRASTGVSTKAGWAHRNVSGRADRIQTVLDYGRGKYELGGNYELPDFWGTDQTFSTALKLHKERLKAYDVQGGGATFKLEKPLSPALSFKYGIGFEHQRVTQDSKTKSLNIFSLPLGLVYDSRDDILNPKAGMNLKGFVTPKFGQLGKIRNLFRLQLYGAKYWSLGSQQTLSVWGRYTSIVGASYDKLPMTERIFMGGGSSIRGYSYQLASPIDRSDKPIGAKETFEFGIEPRMQFSEDWGGVIFYEGGLIPKRHKIRDSEKFFQGVGVGVRYFTSFGPIRADLAFPLKRRKKQNGKPLDAPFQLYISIGQAF